ncbi:unnamed protein product [Hermetia illucens]|uniref:Major facilitator superfamily (MFS) profile domain-containing protein n=1 Tax=Hermetia illucens TaxID=343691 RepID=A0A7R8YZJ5_HERIL|nr:synaptic vesicle glycoprotein 2C-like isoform X2 [Hermetia illucens]CAD7090047.1 unnamed protein product [Hermetia illucens]
MGANIIASEASYKVCNQTRRTLYTFDEAAALCGTGKFHTFLFVVCGLCTLTLMTATLSVGFYIMFVKCDLEVSVYEQGLLASTAFIGIVVSSHTWGFLSDTWGRLKVIQISIFGSVILALVSAFSYTTWMLILLRLLVGVFICGTQSSIFSYLGEFHSMKTKSQAVTYLSVFLSVALVFLPALAIGILPLEFDWMLYGKPFPSWRLLEIVYTIPGIIASLGLPFLPESPKYLFTKSDHQKAIDVLQYIYHVNTGNSREEYPAKGFSDSEKSRNLKEVNGIRSALLLVWKQTAPMFYRSRVFVTLNLLVHIFISYFAAHGVFMWFPEILNALVKHIEADMTVCEIMRYEFDASTNATGVSSGNLGCASYVDIVTYQVMIIMGALYTLVYFSAGYLVKAVEKKYLMMFWFLFAGVTAIPLIWVRGFYPIVVLFICFLVVGVCGGLVTTIAVDFYPTGISAMAVCLIMMIGRIGVVAGSNSVGIILNTNCEAIFYGLGSLSCAVVVLSFLLPTSLTKKEKVNNPS